MSLLRAASFDHYNAEAGPSNFSQRQQPQACSSWRDVMLATHPQYASHSARSPDFARSHSATSSQSSIASARSWRPLPPIPVPPSPATPSTPSERSSSHPHPRPLPTPPLRIETPCSRAPSTNSSPVFRPLPKPVAPKIDTTHLCPPARPALSLLINTPGMSTTEIKLESPASTSPMSPVVFSKPDSPVDMEESVARRLSTMGFREVEEGTYPRISLDPASEEGYGSPHGSPSSRTASTEELREDVEIRVELRSARPESRASRLWVCEKKGRRWIERNYDEILQQLRKL
ncbi:hypothetical protein PsYK624_036650 [Phanerochaete sordida]|uniref:Uncharacterized protein n=1 Tax=Phanerochaete sordida TaxID=48140 RepID=A0A9P3LB90_9APHY|nr:hypothetical protein PsYK624_036650 [Phanerochaete sordida]